MDNAALRGFHKRLHEVYHRDVRFQVRNSQMACESVPFVLIDHETVVGKAEMPESAERTMLSECFRAKMDKIHSVRAAIVSAAVNGRPPKDLQRTSDHLDINRLRTVEAH